MSRAVTTPFLICALLVGLTAVEVLRGQVDATLDFYFIDVEGGQATLVVTPARQSMLIDAGNPGDRDAGRIEAVARQAGLTRLDVMLTTHLDGDHHGGVSDVLTRLPVGTFVDHGPLRERTNELDALYEGYVKARAGGRHIEAKPGDRIPIRDLDATIVASDGALLASPLPGAGEPNPLCENSKMHDPDRTENAYSLGAVIVSGRFRMLDLGDLNWNNEYMLACPNDLIGPIDLYLTTHHGLFQSGADVLVHAVKPRVAIMNNGATKGGSTSAMRIVRSSPGLLDFWQIHYAVDSDANMPPAMIANPNEFSSYGFEVRARSDGSFTVTNQRTHETKKYDGR